MTSTNGRDVVVRLTANGGRAGECGGPSRYVFSRIIIEARW